MKKIAFIVVSLVAWSAGITAMGEGFLSSPSPMQTKYDRGTVGTDVSLFETKKAVRDRLGIPDEVVDINKETKGAYNEFNDPIVYSVTSNDPKRAIPDGSSWAQFDEWTHMQKLAGGSETGYFSVTFDRETKKVKKVGCFAKATDNPFVCGVITVAKENDNLDPTTIAIGETEEQLKKMLGEPSFEKVDAASFSKTIDYKKFNLEFNLVHGKTYMISVGEIQ
jgi:hypothetical protein